MHDTNERLDPGPILQTAFAFWSSKVLLTSVAFGVFTKLGKEGITGYDYEPWHVRYLGKDVALRVKNSGLTLHEFLLK